MEKSSTELQSEPNSAKEIAAFLTEARGNKELFFESFFVGKLVQNIEKSLGSDYEDISIFDICKESIQIGVVKNKEFEKLAKLFIDYLELKVSATGESQISAKVVQVLIYMAEFCWKVDRPDEFLNKVAGVVCDKRFWTDGFQWKMLREVKKGIIDDRGRAILDIVMRKECLSHIVTWFIDAAEAVGNETVEDFTQLFSRIIDGCENEIALVKPHKVITRLLGSKSPHEKSYKLFDYFKAKAERLQSDWASQDLKKFIIKILVSQNISEDLAFRMFSEVDKEVWNKEYLSEDYRVKLKTLVLTSENLIKRQYLLSIVSPWLEERFSKIDLKLIVKTCQRSAEFIEKLYGCIYSSLKTCADNRNHFRLTDDKSIRIFVEYPFLKTQQFSMCLSYYYMNKESSCFIKVKLNKALALCLIFQNNKVLLQVTNDKKKYRAVVETALLLYEEKWNSVSFGIVSGDDPKNRYLVCLKINSLSENVYLKKLKKIQTINEIELAGECKVEYIYLYPFLTDHKGLVRGLAGIESCENQPEEIIKISPDVTICTSEHFLGIKNKSLIYYETSHYTLQRNIESIRYLIPPLEYSDSVCDFEMLIKILNSIFISPDLFLNLDSKALTHLQSILNNKPFLSTAEFLLTIESLVNTIHHFPNYSEVYEILFLNLSFWKNLSEMHLIHYLETIKIHLAYFKQNELESIYNSFLCFFAELLTTFPVSSRNLIIDYYYIIFGFILEKVSIDNKLHIFDMVFNDIIKNDMINDDFTTFICSLYSFHWKVIDEDNLYHIIDNLALNYSKVPQKSVGFLLNLFFKFIEIYYRLNKSDFFVMNLKIRLDSIFFHCENFWICEVTCEFLSKEGVFAEVLGEIFELLTKNLTQVKKIEGIYIEQNLKTISNYCERSRYFCEVVSQQRDFPGWIVEIIENTEQIYDPLFNIIVKSCSQLFNAKDFCSLKRILVKLWKRGQSPKVFKILKEVFLNSFIISFQSWKVKYVIHFFNTTEDLLMTFPYFSVPKNEFLDFVVFSISNLKEFQYPQDFANLPGLKSFDSTVKKETFLTEKIVVRQGGVLRQTLVMVLYCLSFGQNSELEDYLVGLSQARAKDDKSILKTLENDDSIQFSANIEGKSRKSAKNLNMFFIYIEWAEIIYSYMAQGLPEEAVSKSLFNFTKFVVKAEISLKLKKEIKKSLDLNGFKELNKTLKDSIDHLNFEYIPESIQMKFYNCKWPDFELDTNKSDLNTQRQKLIKSLKTHMKKLANIKNLNDTKSIILELFDNPSLSLFFKTLTTVKVKKLAEFYYTSSPQSPVKHLRKSLSTFPIRQNPSIKESTKFIPPSQASKFIANKKLDFFYGRFDQLGTGKLKIRSKLDYQGKPSFLKRSKSSYQRPDIADPEPSDFLYQVNAEEVLSFLKNRPLYELIDSEDFLSSSSSLFNSFSCELVKIQGSLFGSLKLKQDSLVFTSSSKTKPIINPIIKIPDMDQPVICSATLPEFQIKLEKTKKIKFSKIKEVIPKYFIHNLCSLELYTVSGKSYFFNFFHSIFLRQVFSSLKSCLKNSVFLTQKHLNQFTASWKEGKTSNFEYILQVNKFSSRSFNNLSQYPVFPWVLKDYSSKKINLKDDSVYRDLTHPISAQTPEARQKSQSNFEASVSDPVGQYNYGTHYSTGGIILNFLIRAEPFTGQNFNLHGKSFDVPDRIFSSIKRTWKISQGLLIDTKEILAEFFYLPEMFFNKNTEKFGKTQTKREVNDVRVPSWAGKNVYNFIYLHRKALESEYVSKNIPLWIDLIFGYRQQGKKAAEDLNLYHPMTYKENYLQILMKWEESYRPLLYSQALLYGQTPDQVFKKPHPQKDLQKKKTFPETLFDPGCYRVLKKLEVEKGIVLTSKKYFFLLKYSEKQVLCFKWSWDNLAQNSEKKQVLQGISNPVQKAAIFQEKLIITSGHPDHSLAVHSFSGTLVRIIQLHTEPVSDLAGGQLLLSSSLDSSVVVWTGSKQKYLNGHIYPVKCVSYQYDLCLAFSCSSYFLIHDFRTGEVLVKLNEKIEKISPAGGFFLGLSRSQIKLFHTNGDFVRVLPQAASSFICFLFDMVFFKENSKIMAVHLFEPVSTVLSTEKIWNVPFIFYNLERDKLVLVNESDCFELVFIEKTNQPKTPKKYELPGTIFNF